MLNLKDGKLITIIDNDWIETDYYYTDWTGEWEDIQYEYVSLTFVFDNHRWTIETNKYDDTNSILFELISDLIETKTLISIEEFKNMVKDLIGFNSEEECILNDKIN